MSNAILDLALKYNRRSCEERLLAIRKLKDAISSNSAKSSEEQGLLRHKMRGHLSAVFRALPGAEKSLRAGSTPFAIPRFDEMTNEMWKSSDGPFHVRWLAKSYGLLGPILPYEAEVTNHMSLSFGNYQARRGNFLLPSEDMWDPHISVAGEAATDGYYSVILIDADYPVEGANRRHQLGLWAKLNSLGADGKVEFRPSEGDTWTCLPAHPARGSDTHRIVGCVFHHRHPLDSSSIKLMKGERDDTAVQSHPKIQDRLTDLRLILKNRDVKLVGFQFYRTCWIRIVSNFYSSIGIPEPIFGESLPP